MKLIPSLIAGACGAVFLNVIHESMRQFIPEAPRVDLIGRQLVAQTFLAMNEPPPPDSKEYALAMTGDILSNTIYYGLVGIGTRHRAPLRGLILGAIGGWGAVKAPNYLDLPQDAVQRHPATRVMTVAWYTLGGLAAGIAARRFAAS